MTYDPSQQYLPPAPYRSQRQILLDWMLYYARTHGGEKPSYGWLAQKTGIHKRQISRLLHQEVNGAE